MKLYLIRHGQSEANLQKSHAGWAQVPLTEKGREDALRAKKVLEGIAFDKVYSSDLIRAIETQQLALPDAEAERTQLLREVNVGSLAGKSIPQCLEEMGEAYIEHRRCFEFSTYGGESYGQFCTRIREFLTVMENSSYQKVAAFCHGGLINTVLDVITGERLDRTRFACENCSVSVFEYKGGKWRLVLWNYMGEI